MRKSVGLYFTVASVSGGMMSSSGLPSSSVWPSAPVSIFCTPIAPPTPPMFSMIKGWPKAFWVSFWIWRATKSDGPVPPATARPG